MPPSSPPSTRQQQAAVASRTRLSGTPAFAVVAVVLGLALAASAAPTPLYGVYQERWGFSTLTLTLVYAVYCFGVLGALLVAGRISDVAGRRPVLVGALGGLIGSTILFALAGSVAWLFAARLLQGLSTGVAMGAAGAALIDLHPGRDGNRVGLVNGTVSAGAMGAGAIVTALLVEYGPAPRVLPFVVLGLLFAFALAATLALPEPIEARSRPALRIQRPRIPPSIRGPFALAALGVIASWSIGGIYLSLGPRLASEMLHTPSQLAGGAALLALTLPGVLAQLRCHRLPPHRAAAGGAAVLAGGMALSVVSLFSGSAVLFLLGGMVTGAGWGVAFLGALRSLTAVIPDDQRAEVMSAFYVVAYLSLALPAIVAGLVVGDLGLEATFRLFGALVIAVAVAVAVLAAQGAAGTGARSGVALTPSPAPRAAACGASSAASTTPSGRTGA